MGFNTAGAAQGAAAGASFGPWGAAIGGIAGGFMGGDTPSAVQVGPPQAVGGAYTPYGTTIQDPNTGAVYQFGNEAGMSPTELYNQALMAQLMGQTPTGAGSQGGTSYQDARANILAQMSAADQAVHGPRSLEAANLQKDRLQAELAQLDAANKNAGSAASNNPMLQYLSQGKYNNIADIVNLNANSGALEAQQALANRGLGASSLSDMTNRQEALQRGVQLGNTLQQVGQQDMSSRLAMLQALQGQNSSINQNRLANAGMGLGMGQFAGGLSQNFANASMGINATNAGLQNANNWAGYNANQQMMSGLAGIAGNSNWGSHGSSSAGTPIRSAPLDYSGSGSFNPNGPSPYAGLNSGFSTNMTAAGGK